MSVDIDVRDRIARITLNRPDVGNALDLELATALHQAAKGLQGSDVGAVILTGAGKAFCVGGDLHYMRGADEVGDAVLRLATQFHAAIEALAALDAPVISAVRGAAAGGGMSLAIAADIVLAAESARFTMAYTAIGFPPDGGSSWTLPRLVGQRRATELMLLNPRLDAATAHHPGLSTRAPAGPPPPPWGSSPAACPTTRSTTRPPRSPAGSPTARPAPTAPSSA